MLNNKYNKAHLFFGLMAAVMLFMGCGQEKNQIEGMWVLEKAERNGQETGTLTDMYMDFTTPDTLRTNLFGIEEHFPYSLDKGVVYVESRAEPLNFDILEQTEKDLILQGKIRGTDFTFELRAVPKL